MSFRNRVKRAPSLDPKALSDLEKAFKQGLKRHQQGALDDAAKIYRAILEANPEHAGSLHLLGVIHSQRGDHAAAIEHIDAALAIEPTLAEAFNNKGNALMALKRTGEALQSYDQAIALKGNYYDALNNRGIVLKDLNRIDEALASIDQAIGIRPESAEPFYNRGNALLALKRFDEAIESYDKAIALKPNYAEAFSNRGFALKGLKRLDEAVASCDQAIALRHNHVEAFHNRGAALEELKRYEEAVASYDQAILLKPDYAEAFQNRGRSLEEAGRLEEAVSSYDQAITIKPNYTVALNGRANALVALKQVDQALSDYDRAIALRRDYAEAYNNRGMARLLNGDYRGGWPDYEWRWKAKAFPSKRPRVGGADWQGEDLRERSILVHTEQGAGDVIQFARYLPLLVRRGAKVTLLSDPILVRLIGTASPEVGVVRSVKRKEPFDFQCALLGLPLRFGTDVHSIPNSVPYLRADADRVAHWKQIVGERGFKIGIAWQGKPEGKIDRGRSFPLAELAPIARLPDARLISLQKNHGLDQLKGLPADVRVETLGDDFDSGPDAFVDTAAVMANLDLIITSDTSIAHLAGALGRPTWLALKHVPDWRWMLDREDSPWYPTMRLFRQESRGDWKSVFAKIEQELGTLMDNGAKPQRTNGAARSERVKEEQNAPAPDRHDATVARPASEPKSASSSPLVENGTLRLKQCRHGAIMYHANDAYIGRSLDLYGEFSEGEIEVFQQLLRPGMTVLDIGANIGAHTVYFAKTVGPSGKVLAFEPQRILFQMLCGNVALNALNNVVAVNAALGREQGSILVPRVDYSKGGNFGGMSLGKWDSGEDVPVQTLDSYALNACHLIKIDVEGMEQQVLESGASLVARHKPILYVENDRTEKSKALIDWLFAAGYRLYWHLPRLFNPANFFGERNNVFGKTVSINMLCVPRGKTLDSPLREITSSDDSWRSPPTTRSA